MMYKRRPPVYEPISKDLHPEYEVKDTRVSDYLRKYGSGKIENLPQTSAPEITDARTVDQMLDEPCESMATETIDVLAEIERNRDAFKQAAETIKMTQAKRKKFDDAVKALNDPNCPTERQREAYAVLSDLESQGYITRARD